MRKDKTIEPEAHMYYDIICESAVQSSLFIFKVICIGALISWLVIMLFIINQFLVFQMLCKSKKLCIGRKQYDLNSYLQWLTHCVYWSYVIRNLSVVNRTVHMWLKIYKYCLAQNISRPLPNIIIKKIKILRIFKFKQINSVRKFKISKFILFSLCFKHY